jgi:orotidine-5'-phosphate decarboxylase
MAPAEAVERGADLVVVGRGIVGAEDPVAAAVNFSEALES